MEDTINRSDAIKVLNDGMNKWYSNVTLRQSMREAINSIPSAEKQGEWIVHFDDLFPEESTEECSVCHAEQLINGNDDNFCPNCGAKMTDKDIDVPYKKASDQRDYDGTYEPTYNDQDGSM